MISINDIHDYFSCNHKNERKTLRDTSRSNGDYLTERTQYAYHFDSIVDGSYSSCDALFISPDQNCIYLIEFKNQPCIKADKNPPKDINNNLKLKATDSLIFLYNKFKQEKLLNSRSEMLKLKKKMIIVYSEEKTNYQIDITQRSRVFAKVGYIFQVENYADYLYDDIVVIPNTKFEDYELK
ncbi:MAG: hypothetical protein K9N06_10605 [Candidatus Cloacimonetes bacterium]|nr:hypothetical protein [Candidatus Cloacimonadota bacterium]